MVSKGWASACALAWCQAQAAAPLPALNSYGQPPFVPVDGGAGLAAQLVEQLNEALDDGPPLALETLPRRRIELALANPRFTGTVLFLAPEFLAPAVQQGAAWSVPVMVDENLLVSTRPLQVSGLDDLHGLRMGGIAGHVYRVLGPLVEAGRIGREDAVDHIANLKKLCLGRVDFVVISKSELAGTSPHAPCARPFRRHAFPEPQVILRRVMVRMPDAGQAQRLLGAVAAIACSDKWVAALNRYGLATAGCRAPEAARSDRPGR